MRNHTNRHRHFMEAIESRLLLAANIYNIVGTDGPDDIRVSWIKVTNNDVLSIDAPGWHQTYYAPDAALIKIFGRGGNDKITYTDSQDSGKAPPIVISGEGGDDTIQLGHDQRFRIDFLDYNDMQIDGGSGNDKIVMDSSKINRNVSSEIAYDYIAYNNSSVRQTYLNIETIDIKSYAGNTNYFVNGLKPGTTLNITGSTGANKLYLGMGNLNLMQGKVNFDGVSGNDSVLIDDSQNLLPRTYSNWQDNGIFSGSNGRWSAKNVDSLEMKGSQGSNVFKFFGLQAGMPTTISPNAGNDVLEIGGGDYNHNIKSPVYFWDGTNNTGKVVIDDHLSTADDAYAVSGGQFTKTGGQVLQYAFVKSVSLSAGQGANVITVTPSTGTEFFIDGNEHSPAGDSLNLNLAPSETAVRTGSGDSGSYLFATKKTITFQEIENAMASQNLPTISIDDQVVFEGDNGDKIITFTAKLSSATFLPVSVDFNVTNNTAKAGLDFDGVLPINRVIPVGQTTVVYSVVIHGDTVYESDESFFVDLSNVTNATILKGRGIGAIINDDINPSDTLPA